MRRAVPLLRSDFQWESMDDVIEGNQGQTYGLSSWLPFQGTGVYFYDSYSYRSFYMAGFGMGGLSPENTVAQQQAYSECRKIAPDMLFGDYYPLTPYSLQHDQWIAWQFNRPEQGTGVIQVFRRDNCEESEKAFCLSGLNPDEQYEITNFDVEGSTKFSGKELMGKGLTVEIKDKPGAAVITYQKIESHR
jgi:alpha-galactosidase